MAAMLCPWQVKALTGSVVLSSFGASVDRRSLGMLGGIAVVPFGTKRFIHLLPPAPSSCRATKPVSTLMLCGRDEFALDELQAVVATAVSTLNGLLRLPIVVPGAGSFERLCARFLRSSVDLERPRIGARVEPLVGETRCLSGLASRPEMNGRLVRCLRKVAGGRVQVRLENSSTESPSLSVKVESLMPELEWLSSQDPKFKVAVEDLADAMDTIGLGLEPDLPRDVVSDAWSVSRCEIDASGAVVEQYFGWNTEEQAPCSVLTLCEATPVSDCAFAATDIRIESASLLDSLFVKLNAMKGAIDVVNALIRIDGVVRDTR